MLDKYKIMVKFLSKTLGGKYEVVLHWINDEGDYYIAAIENPEISGRNLNSPITGFALNLIENHIYEKEDFITNYKASSKDNQNIEGATLFIKDINGVLKGLLCINFNPNKYIDLANQLLKLGNVDKIKTSSEDDSCKEGNGSACDYLDSVEMFHSSIEEIIFSIIDPILLQNDVKLSQDLKIDICEKLKEKGVFKIKGALPQVAAILGISEPSVYRYLKIINERRTI